MRTSAGRSSTRELLPLDVCPEAVGSAATLINTLTCPSPDQEISGDAATPLINNSKGAHTGAIVGFSSGMPKMRQQYNQAGNMIPRKNWPPRASA
jgi:hypothetical protein